MNKDENSENDQRGPLARFLFPRLTRHFVIRFLLLAACAYVFFGHVCLPMRIQGPSMEPTYHDGGFTFGWRLTYVFRQPRRHDVVMVRLAGTRVMFLKRIVAFAGETVEFKDGKLYVDGKELREPYVKYPCDWNKSPVRVSAGCVYVVGDNRSVPIEEHQFGQIEMKRIAGSTIW